MDDWTPDTEDSARTEGLWQGLFAPDLRAPGVGWHGDPGLQDAFDRGHAEGARERRAQSRRRRLRRLIAPKEQKNTRRVTP